MITQGEGAARLIGGQTAKTISQGFVTLQTAGVRELAAEYERMAKEFGKTANFRPIVRKAAQIIADGYGRRVGDVTGNLKASIDIKTKDYGSAMVAIVGPVQTGSKGSSDEQASGNHAWIVEFGTRRRAPGSGGRRAYINVHQAINGKMRRHSSMNNRQFANMSRGYYFLMSSYREPTRQARDGSGYPHDFGFTNGKQHPITLHPGETIAPMPAKHPMERTINSSQQAVFNSLRNAIQNSMDKLTR